MVEKKDKLNEVFEGLARGETPDFLTMMEAISDISDIMTADNGQANGNEYHSPTCAGGACPTCG